MKERLNRGLVRAVGFLAIAVIILFVIGLIYKSIPKIGFIITVSCAAFIIGFFYGLFKEKKK